MEVYIVVVIALFFSAYFSGMEVAFLNANRLKIELESQQGSWSAKITSGFLRKPSKFIGTLLLGNAIVLVFYSVYMAKLVDLVFVNSEISIVYVIVAQITIAALILVFIGEFMPKSLFRINSNDLLTALAVPNYVIYILLWLPMSALVAVSEFLVRVVFRVKISRQALVFGRVDLDDYVRELAENIPDDEGEVENEVKIFRNALDFKEVKARECMVPRNEIIAIEIDAPVSELREIFIDTRHSKVLVYRETIDNIIGYVHVKELFHKHELIKKSIVPVIIVPETMSAKEVLQLFIKQNRSIAVVVDEFGGTSGMISIEDIIEQIFGDIDDEHDTEDFIEEQIDERNFLFSARLEIDYLNEKYKLKLPENDNYETLAGLIIHYFEDIPGLNSVIVIENFSFTILAVSETRIETVRLQIQDE